MLKIFQIIPMFSVGGAEIMAENLIYELKNLGCDVSAVSFYDYQSDITDRLEENGIRIIYLGKKKGFDFKLFFRLYKLFKSEKPDVVHTHIGAAQYVFPVSFLTKIKKVVHTVHNVADKETSAFNQRINKVYFKYAGFIPVALSGLVQKSIEKVYGIHADRVPVVLNGMPLDKYIAKTDYSFSDNVNIVHIGRFGKQKNHIRSIEAFEKVVQKYPSARLNLFGEGELLPLVKQRVFEKNIESNVTFCGLSSNIPDELSGNDIFCLPSDYEGVPMTLIEAMASAMPIVATKVGGVPDMLGNGEDALLCDCDSDAVADCLIKLIESKELREKFGKNALKRSIEFSSETMAKRYLSLYERDNKL